MKTINKLDEISNISYKTKSKDTVEIVYRSLGYLREFNIPLQFGQVIFIHSLNNSHVVII